MSRQIVVEHNRRIAMPSLWQSIRTICPEMAEKRPAILSVIGAGGKTTWIMNLARECMETGKKVLVITTTHMKRPAAWGVLTGNPRDIEKQLLQEGIAVAGIPCENGKITFIGNACYDAVKATADVILIEADGARRMPLKAMGLHEPVIMEDSQLILCVAGLESLGKTAAEGCFRWNEISLAKDQIITNDLFSTIWRDYCLQPVAARYSQPIIPVLNQCDTPRRVMQGQQIFRQCHSEKGIISTFAEGERSR